MTWRLIEGSDLLKKFTFTTKNSNVSTRLESAPGFRARTILPTNPRGVSKRGTRHFLPWTQLNTVHRTELRDTMGTFEVGGGSGAIDRHSEQDEVSSSGWSNDMASTKETFKAQCLAYYMMHALEFLDPEFDLGDRKVTLDQLKRFLAYFPSEATGKPTGKQSKPKLTDRVVSLEAALIKALEGRFFTFHGLAPGGGLKIAPAMPVGDFLSMGIRMTLMGVSATPRVMQSTSSGESGAEGEKHQPTVESGDDEGESEGSGDNESVQEDEEQQSGHHHENAEAEKEDPGSIVPPKGSSMDETEDEIEYEDTDEDGDKVYTVEAEGGGGGSDEDECEYEDGTGDDDDSGS
ncbi:hypothetical protein B0H11DRAFT_1910394 [Mycena galericulata]|nr:hypothetical protein B0H11DRAFT_1910394 [Mycena galericulata]